MTSTPTHRQATLPPAAVLRRVAAGAIDLGVGGALWGGLVLALGLVLTRDVYAWIAATLVIVTLRELLVARTGWSPGGRIMGVRLVDAGTGGPPMMRLFIHADLLFITMVPSALLASIPLMRMAATDPRGQSWHDRKAGILVVSTRRTARSRHADNRLEARTGGPARATGSARAGSGTGADPDPRRRESRRQASKRQSQSQRPHHAAPRPTRQGSRASENQIFPEESFFLSPEGSSAEALGRTVDTASMVALPPSSDRTIIDSVPWASVPTQIDAPTADELPFASGAGEAPEALAAPAPVAGPASSATSAQSASGAEPPPSTLSAPAHRPSPLEEPVTVSPSPESASAASPQPASGPSASSPGIIGSVPGTTMSSTGSAASMASMSSVPQVLREAAQAFDPATPPIVSASSPATARGRHRHTEDPRASRLVPLAGGAPIRLRSTTVVGRDPDNISDYRNAACVPLGDSNRSVSKTHAALAPAPGGLWITDLHSTNGTRVEIEGEVSPVHPGEPVPVPTGATIILGSAAYRVED